MLFFSGCQAWDDIEDIGHDRLEKGCLVTIDAMGCHPKLKRYKMPFIFCLG